MTAEKNLHDAVGVEGTAQAEFALEESRQAIADYLGSHEPKPSQAANSGQRAVASNAAPEVSAASLRALKALLRQWWYAHPAHAAAHALKPVLEKEIQRHPLPALGASVAVGGALVLLFPWRKLPWLAFRGAHLLIQSTNISSMLLNAFTGKNRKP